MAGVIKAIGVIIICMELVTINGLMAGSIRENI
jgi:hypothetical protein